jgi:hypothetical protein
MICSRYLSISSAPTIIYIKPNINYKTAECVDAFYKVFSPKTLGSQKVQVYYLLRTTDKTSNILTSSTLVDKILISNE